jgi:uncharacterized protein YxjI
MRQKPLAPLHPHADAQVRLTGPTPPEPAPQHILGDPFSNDRFLLKQRMLTISQKYDVCDEAGNKILFVHRPAHVLRSLCAMLGAIVVFFVVMGSAMALASAVAGSNKSLEWVLGLGALFGFLAALGGAVLVGVGLSPRRHVTMFRDEGMTEALLHVRQDQKWALINMRYTVADREGAPLCLLRKNYFYDIFRKKWICEDMSGGVVCIIREDSMLKAFLRRFIGGVLGALLRTNFIITDAAQQRQLGKFDRKFTIMDRYVLDVSADAERVIDRRVAVAIGVMLDTGERR